MTHTITLTLTDDELTDLRLWQAQRPKDRTPERPCLQALLTAELPAYVPTPGDLIDIRPAPAPDSSYGMRSVSAGERVIAVTDRHVFTEYDWSADVYDRAKFEFRLHDADTAEDWTWGRC